MVSRTAAFFNPSGLQVDKNIPGTFLVIAELYLFKNTASEIGSLKSMNSNIAMI